MERERKDGEKGRGEGRGEGRRREKEGRREVGREGSEGEVKVDNIDLGLVEPCPEANFKSNSNISHHGNKEDLLLLNLDIQSLSLFPF